MHSSIHSPREKIWLIVRDFGPLTPAAIAERSSIDLHDVRKLLVELHVCRFIESVRVPDPLSGDEVTMAEVAGGMAYDEAYAERRLAQYLQQLREREELEAASPTQKIFNLSSSSPSPATPPRPALGDRQLSFIGTHGEQCHRIIEYLRQHGTATCDELEVGANINRGSLGWRMKELSAAGRIRKTGDKRLTRLKTPADVWELTPHG